ncbi:hypothetical protein KPH14_001177 [Odynerus spinipes]|uniref:Uncharacterized protein n=1 Tax=Odynerus spinipes TaxID=1348599 RepID=A0AAD9VR00_9HYME|nr:hypothetical protein KPH14_001177 [Odynerus spinipes]
MSNIKAILATVLALLSTAVAHPISRECEVEQNQITCQCDRNQDFYLPGEHNYTNATSLSISSCSTARLLFPHLSEAIHMRQLIVQNISDELIIEVLFGTRNISRFELVNIKKIPLISHEAFNGFQNIGRLEIRNAFVERFEEHFVETNVNELVLVNVTIAHVEGFNFMEKGKNLEIINCEFRNISTTLKFYFSNVKIVNSTFEMQKKGTISIDSDYALLENNVLFNISMEVFASNLIKISGTCGDGTSSLRLESNNTESIRNRLPSGINYSLSKRNNESEPVVQYDNVICIAGNCKCPKTSGQNGSEGMTSSLKIFFIWLTYMTLKCNVV